MDRQHPHSGPIRRLVIMLYTVLLLNLSWVPLGHAEQITLNLNNADIEALIKTVSEHTGKNFVIDPRVKGKVTVISAHPMERDEFYQVFLSILEVHGFSTIPSGDVIKVVPDVKAKQGGIPTVSALGQLPGDQIVTRIIQVKNVTSAQLVPILRPLIPQEGHLAAYPDTNVLIISDRRQNVDRLMKIIEQIDRVSDSSIEVITLQHASAAEVVRILNSLQTPAAAKGGKKNATKLVADERTNSILISGDPTARLRSRVIIEHLDTPFDNEGNAQVIYLKYANATDLVQVLTGVSENLDETKQAGGAKAKGKPKLPINIQADEASNALIITAPPDQFRALQAIIRKLDIRRAQVLVEAIIAEVSYDKAKQLGVQWIVDGSPDDKGPIGVINLGSPSISDIASSVVAETGVPLGPGTSLAFGRFNSDRINFAAVIQALESDSTSNILSTPTITTLDNQEAEIVIGQNVPFITGSYSSTGGVSNSVNPFQTVQREDVGLTLKVKPQINEGNSIQLEIEQEISSINASASSGTSDIVTNKRTIKTVVMVDDGNTIVLGGLLEEDLQQTEEKVPLLGDIPLLGALFRANRTTKIKRNLMVFLRPVVIRDDAVNTQIASEKYNYFRAQQMRMKQEGVNLMSDEELPVLPPRFGTLAPPFDDEELEPEN
ncbi:MAG: type II secretion system secretin GspD [Candidatus Thiodiazotropha sp.]|nr:type II secretion system secretin GspD [Candidatus Thiodiazotropha taylori]MBT3059550.1 type II secretion system secretin GspD [Candidatus Thiodiazotropha sp. (ex Lucina pensylvanica)]MBV2094043.1 type II secretion system secretin GspD [Candidatus Thiodiazotropha sp. (ex Codakia orbicularis)]PUB74636.1 MAG: type II secretion system protein GspD [gamma proteobacterium symbiont of Ctena orbiculata]MBT3063918.1 type II secretion system secretin GspD [Candidatus Thiodiazotropha sp. (ex Lucina pe